MTQSKKAPRKKVAETKTLIAVMITFSVMIIEITAGWYYGSMALFADGWHMLTHTAALGISFIAYVLARRLSGDGRFNYGTWKIEVLGAYTSAILLGLIGIYITYISIERLMTPVDIQHDQALVVAVIGLLVNLICAVALYDPRHHLHGHTHSGLGHHTHDQTQEGDPIETADLNLKSAYLHVVVDAMNSVLAIIALLGAKFYGLNFLDPVMGIVGAVLICRWTYLLIRDTSSILLDREDLSLMKQHISEHMEMETDVLSVEVDLHRVEQHRFDCVVRLISDAPQKPFVYKQRLKHFGNLNQVSIEVTPVPRIKVNT